MKRLACRLPWPGAFLVLAARGLGELERVFLKNIWGVPAWRDLPLMVCP